jgi:hypothetical protein
MAELSGELLSIDLLFFEPALACRFCTGQRVDAEERAVLASGHALVLSLHRVE